MSRLMVIDIETENRAYFGALASPRHPENYVVTVGQAIDTQPFDGAITGEYFTSRPEKWLSIPDDVWLLVAHNAPFEMDWMLVQEREEIMRFLARGGRVFCTAYAEYLLTNQQETYPSLNDTAPKYGGSAKVDGVKILWEQGKLTSEIDKELLFDEYLIGPGGDIDNTRKVFYGQYALLVSRGMWDMALARMEGMLYNCFAMDSGLYVDRDTAFKQLEQQNEKLAELRAAFAEYRQHIPEHVQFKDSSDYHMSAWLFGGPIKFKQRDTWFEDDGVTPKYANVECYKFGEQFVQCAEITAEQYEQCVQQYGAVDRYVSGKNKGQPKVHKVKSCTPKQKWYDRVYQCEPSVDLNLLPREIQKEFKQEFASKRKLADESPVYSTGADCIEMLSKREELPEDIREVLKKLLTFAKIDKDVGTYYLREDRDEDGNVVKQSGMLQYLTPASIVYHVLNCTATVTTRLSSSRPNMQNIPRGDTSEVKRMFTSRYGTAGRIIEADYSALEVVCLAAFSKDKNLTRALLDNIDMHCMRLSQQLGEPYEDVLRKCKDESDPDHKRYKTLRTNIKPKAFAYQYGATAAGVAFATGCTVEEAQAFIDAEKSLFPDVEAYYENTVFAEVERTAVMHREQNDNGGWRVYKRGTWTSPAGTTFEFRQYPKTSRVNGQRIEGMAFKPTQMRNYPIQGESGFFVQVIAGRVFRWLLSRNFFDGKVCIINQVHDALYLDCHESVLQDVAVGLKQIMESIPQVMQAYGYDLTVPFPAEVEAGLNMLEKGKVV